MILLFPLSIILLLFYQRIMERWTAGLRPPHLSAGVFCSLPVLAIPSHLWCPCPARAAGAQFDVSTASRRKSWKSQPGMAPCAAALVDLFLMRLAQGQAAPESEFGEILCSLCHPTLPHQCLSLLPLPIHEGQRNREEKGKTGDKKQPVEHLNFKKLNKTIRESFYILIAASKIIFTRFFSLRVCHFFF